MSPTRTTGAQQLTQLVLLVFRVNGELLEAGDRLVRPLRLTSSRWQILGAIALADSPRSAPQLAAQMGMTRQGAQKQLDFLLDDGLVAAQPNPRHARSPLYLLTHTGRSVYAATERVQAKWANRLARHLTLNELESARRTLEHLSQQLTALMADDRQDTQRRSHA